MLEAPPGTGVLLVAVDVLVPVVEDVADALVDVEPALSVGVSVAPSFFKGDITLNS